MTAVEAIGDITATEEASRLPTAGADHRRRIQGGLLGDGASCSPSSLCSLLLAEEEQHVPLAILCITQWLREGGTHFT